jgi:hypothetical protein
MSYSNKDDHDEFIKCLRDSDDLIALRQQREKIEKDRIREAKRQRDEEEANRLRKEIINLGHEPCA